MVTPKALKKSNSGSGQIHTNATHDTKKESCSSSNSIKITSRKRFNNKS